MGRGVLGGVLNPMDWARPSGRIGVRRMEGMPGEKLVQAREALAWGRKCTHHVTAAAHARPGHLNAPHSRDPVTGICDACCHQASAPYMAPSTICHVNPTLCPSCLPPPLVGARQRVLDGPRGHPWHRLRPPRRHLVAGLHRHRDAHWHAPLAAPGQPVDRHVHHRQVRGGAAPPQGHW